MLMSKAIFLLIKFHFTQNSVISRSPTVITTSLSHDETPSLAVELTKTTKNTPQSLHFFFNLAQRIGFQIHRTPWHQNTLNT